MSRTVLSRTAVAIVVAVLCTGSLVVGPRRAGSQEVSLASTEVSATAVSAAVPLAGKVSAPAEGAYVGVFKPPAPYQINTALNTYAEQSSSKRPAVLMWFQPWAAGYSRDFTASWANAAWARGAVPLIAWEPWDPADHYQNQPAYQLRDIIDGDYDAYIRTWARAIKAAGGPVMLRPMHEMNGNWYPWCGSVNGNSPAQFRAAWRHVHDIFRAEGATNVTWVWSINGRSSPNTYEHRFAAYYPGDAYVDWTSISGYNWGTTRDWSKWQQFEEMYAAPLAYLRSVGKPVIISEIASVSNGGSKPAWIKHTYAMIRWHYPEVKAIVYYDKSESGGRNGVQDWAIASSKASARSYRRAVSHRRYVAGPVRALSSWQSRAAAWNGSAFSTGFAPAP